MIKAYTNLEMRTRRAGESNAIVSKRTDTFTIDCDDNTEVDEHYLQERAIATVLEHPDLRRRGYSRQDVTILYFSVTY